MGTDIGIPKMNSPERLQNASGKFLPNEIVVVQEKIDGSQFSFMKGHDGRKYYRSRKNMISEDSAGNLFSAAIAGASRFLDKAKSGVVFRAEAMRGAKHNKLQYKTAPRNNFLIYCVGDVNRQQKEGLLGEDFVQCLYTGKLKDMPVHDKLLAMESQLGGKMEGFVIRGLESGTVAKVVSQEFRETKSVKKTTKSDVIDSIVDEVATTARIDKAIQHLSEEGKIGHEPGDIGKIIGEFAQDIAREESELIKDRLFDAYWKQIHAEAVKKVAPYYLDTYLPSIGCLEG